MRGLLSSAVLLLVKYAAVKRVYLSTLVDVYTVAIIVVICLHCRPSPSPSGPVRLRHVVFVQGVRRACAAAVKSTIFSRVCRCSFERIS
jgi:hypothetical protein